MEEVITKLIGFLITFKEEKDRIKKEILAKEISNICSLHFKEAAKNNPKLVHILHPLVALGYFKADSNKFDPDEKELNKLIKELLEISKRPN